MKKIFLFSIFFFLSSCVSQSKKREKSDDHHKIAISLIQKCDNPRALSHLFKALRFSPKDFLIRYTLAVVYYDMEKYDEAVEEFQKVLKRNPKLTEARVVLAMSLMEKGQLDPALKELEVAGKDITYPNYLKLVSQKGLIYYKKKDYWKARKWLQEAFSIPEGKNCFTYLNLGKTELAVGNLKRAEKLLKKSLSLCSRKQGACFQATYEGHYVLAQLYLKKKNKKRAKYHLNLLLKKSEKESELKEARELLKSLS